MSRLSRINTIWRKELVDTLRDRRTLIAMVLVPLALYPAMILGSLQGLEFQISRLKKEEFRVVVSTPEVGRWLRQVIDSDPARRPGAESAPAEELVERAEKGELPGEVTSQPSGRDESTGAAARADVRRHPPTYVIDVIADFRQLRDTVASGAAHVGLVLSTEVPTATGSESAQVTLLTDQTDIRSQIAASGLEAILDRASEFLLKQRLRRVALDPSFIRPIEVSEQTTATPEKVGGSILGQIVPLILIIMTITGAIYPAIDLTAGERERGTLETLMVAPVPTADLITGKFIVVALIGLFSAALNLLSIGGTIYLGGLGEVLTRGGQVVIPLRALPWVLLLLVPLAVMFSALLLAVCSFARSFKEAQNYVMPVMVAAMIPAIIGILPGTRLEGPLLIMPVTNIVVLTRDLFMGKFDLFAIIWVTLSTTLYAAAAVAVAGRLFGQEAVLFADSGSVRTLFQRRFFKPADTPTAAQGFLLLALVFSLNFFVQQMLIKTPLMLTATRYWAALAGVIVVFFLLLPIAAARYMRVRLRTAFNLAWPSPRGWLAGLCFGMAAWILAYAWAAFQSTWLPMAPEVERAFQEVEAKLGGLNPLLMVFFGAVVPGICEEFFFRGYALSGLRSGLGKVAAVLIVGAAFGVHHHSAHRLIVTATLGGLFGLLVVQFRSIWPAVLAHFLTNAMALLANREDALKPVLAHLGFTLEPTGLPPLPWIIGAAIIVLIGVLLCLSGPPQEKNTGHSGDIPASCSSAS